MAGVDCQYMNMLEAKTLEQVVETGKICARTVSFNKPWR